MTIDALVPALIAFLAGALYLIVGRADVKQLALVAFGAALLALMLTLGAQHVRVGGGL